MTAHRRREVSPLATALNLDIRTYSVLRSSTAAAVIVADTAALECANPFAVTVNPILCIHKYATSLIGPRIAFRYFSGHKIRIEPHRAPCGNKREYRYFYINLCFIIANWYKLLGSGYLTVRQLHPLWWQMSL